MYAAACLHRQMPIDHISRLALQVTLPIVSDLPDAPAECPLGLRSRIAWGVGMSAFQVTSKHSVLRYPVAACGA